MSIDGVSESKSTSISLDVYSIKFEECRTIYPLRIVRPLKKNVIDNAEQLSLVVNDLYDNDCTLTQLICDNPKRAQAKQCLCFSSWHPCEYCTCKGTKIVTNALHIAKQKKNIELQRKAVTEKIDNLRQSEPENRSEIKNLENIVKDLNESEQKLKSKLSNIVWPKSSQNATKRTRQEIQDIIEKIENDQVMTKDEMKGITGRSVLFDIPNFDFVLNVPVEYLHCVCIGVCKRCVELTFNVGDARTRVTKRKLCSASQFNALIKHIKVVREFNRRVRDLDFAVYKGQEFRNMLLFFFPIILCCIEENAKERHMWLNLSYMIKACVNPQEEYNTISEHVIKNCSKNFYSLYQSLFGVSNCTYNTHVVGSHVLEMRHSGPLTETSAFSFESFYGEMRHSFVPGTKSPLKQIFSNILIKRTIANHCCEKSMYISEKDMPKECNSMIYCYENQKYEIYKVKRVENDMLICIQQSTFPCTFAETPELNWNLIGVFKKSLLTGSEKRIPKERVKGKVLIVNEFLITCPKNVLLEK